MKGTLIYTFFDAGTMSAPAFIQVTIRVGDEVHSYTYKGKTAKRLDQIQIGSEIDLAEYGKPL